MGSLVSIIIPVYNREILIIETLESIASQTYNNWECILVDDHSTDNSVQVIRDYINGDKRFSFYSRPDNLPKGANACRNYGYDKSKGSIINFFDSDDIMMQDSIYMHVKNIKSKNLDLSIADYEIFDSSTGNVIKTDNHKPIISKTLFEDFLDRNVIFLTPSAFIQRNFIENYDLNFNEKLQAAQEWEFFSKLLFYNPKSSAIQENLTLVRQHSQSITYGGEKDKRRYQYYLARKAMHKFMLEKNIQSKYLEEISLNELRYILYNKKLLMFPIYIYTEIKYLGLLRGVKNFISNMTFIVKNKLSKN